jgi:hypothetical protein
MRWRISSTHAGEIIGYGMDTACPGLSLIKTIEIISLIPVGLISGRVSSAAAIMIPPLLQNISIHTHFLMATITMTMTIINLQHLSPPHAPLRRYSSSNIIWQDHNALFLLRWVS